MRQFKFLEQPKHQHPLAIYHSSNTGGAFMYHDGTSIIKNRGQHPHGLNALRHGNFLSFNMWWENRFKRFQEENGRVNDDFIIQTYAGTIGRFTETYRERKRNNRQYFYTRFPVITRINCQQTTFFNEDLIFSHDIMWVEIDYKIFRNDETI